MKVLQINIFGNLSTGKIACQLARDYEAKGDTCYVAYARGNIPSDVKSYRIGRKLDVYTHAFLSRLNDSCGFHSKRATKRFIKWIKKYNPDLIHLHNIHGYYIDVKLLFEYLKKSGRNVYWTLHDCWAFTGHCCYFDYNKCEKWRSGCHGECVNKKEYPKTLKSNSVRNYEYKKKIFTSLASDKLTIITPSKWLANLVSKSYLSKYKIKVIYNKIDLSMFRNVSSDFKLKYGIYNKKMILGVASTWDRRKGLDTFVDLDKVIDQNNYIIVLVGLDKKQKEYIEEHTNIIGLERTKTQQELVEIYSSADLFFNPTLEDNYPTVNLEAQACGTKVLTFDTGGCRETLINGLGLTISSHNVHVIYKVISSILGDKNDKE